MKITISKNICLNTVLLLLISFGSVHVFAQKSKADILRILKSRNITVSKKTSYIAVLPLNGCFNCIKQREYEVNQIKEKGIIIVYPSTRKIVQESVKKDFKNVTPNTVFIFDDELYYPLFDRNMQKGYITKLN